MRPPAKVSKITLGVEGNRAIIEPFKQVQFIRIPFLLEIGYRISFAHRLADILFLLTSQFEHFILNLLEIFL